MRRKDTLHASSSFRLNGGTITIRFLNRFSFFLSSYPVRSGLLLPFHHSNSTLTSISISTSTSTSNWTADWYGGCLYGGRTQWEEVLIRRTVSFGTRRYFISGRLSIALFFLSPSVFIRRHLDGWLRFGGSC